MIASDQRTMGKSALNALMLHTFTNTLSHLLLQLPFNPRQYCVRFPFLKPPPHISPSGSPSSLIR